MRPFLMWMLVTAGVVHAAQAPAPVPASRTAQWPSTQGPSAQGPREASPSPQSTAPSSPDTRAGRTLPSTVPATPAQRPSSPTPAGPAAAPDLGGLPLYPSAVYLRSYEAGRGQKFHIYGVTLSYADTVNYYRATLKNKGDTLFDSPPTHQFEVGRFRENEMAFPPSVTVKDFTWGGSAGYVNPHAGGQPARFPTLVQIVPAPVSTTTRP